MKLTEFLKLEVVDERGRRLGHVVDLRCPGEPEHGDTREARPVGELIYGKAGWLERLGFRSVEERRAPWESVLSIEGGKILIECRGGNGQAHIDDEAR